MPCNMPILSLWTLQASKGDIHQEQLNNNPSLTFCGLNLGSSARLPPFSTRKLPVGCVCDTCSERTAHGQLNMSHAESHVYQRGHA